MKRREFVKAALTATVGSSAVFAQSDTPKGTTVAPGPLPWMQGLDHGNLPSISTIGAEEIAQSTSSFFNTRQTATLVRLSEVLVPPLNGCPGAIDAQVPEFLDFFVSKSLPEIQLLYQSGLDDLDAEAQKKHGKAFAELDEGDVDGILKPRLATWMQDHYPASQEERFVNAAHHDIRTATLNSGAWLSAAMKKGRPPSQGEVYWYPVEPDLSREPSTGAVCPRG